jgi:hypothetical protein
MASETRVPDLRADKRTLNQLSSQRWPGLSVDTMQEEVLGVLREIWSAHEQSAADLDETCGTKECKRMTDVGFDALAEETDGDLRTAWRTQLAREGKLNAEAGSVRDLVLRQQPSIDQH